MPKGIPSVEATLKLQQSLGEPYAAMVNSAASITVLCASLATVIRRTDPAVGEILQDALNILRMDARALIRAAQAHRPERSAKQDAIALVTAFRADVEGELPNA